MKRILDFNSFINESFLGAHAAFIFVPVDKNFKSLDRDLPNSKTLFPSELTGLGAAGYLLVPSTVETFQFINSPYFKKAYPTTSGGISYTKNPDKDGVIVMNGGDAYSTGKSTGVASVTADVPGFSQNAAFYFKSGNALILEILMKREGWEEIFIKDLARKIGNGFESNKAIQNTFWGGIEDEGQIMKELFAASSEDIGLEITDEEVKKRYDVTEELLDLFKNKPGDFVSLNFSKGTFERISELAKESGSEEISKTIDNLSDLKSAGFFED